MKKTYVQISIVFLTVIFSIMGWLSLGNAINSLQSSNWLFPVLWFALVFIFISLAIVLIENNWLNFLIFLLSFSGSFLFVKNIWHLIVVFLGVAFMWWASLKIRKDMRFNIKIDLWKSIRMGRILIILAFAMIITSQFYFQTKDNEVEELIPQFDASNRASEIIFKNILSKAIPDLNMKELENDELTVDEFILKSQESQMKNNNLNEQEEILEEKIESMTPEQRKAIKEKFQQEMTNQILNNGAMLEMSRDKLSDFVGRDLKGDEPILDVFSDMINEKIANFISPTSIGTQNSFLPAALSIILFLTTFSLASFLSPLGMFLAQLIFRFMVLIKLIEVEKKDVKMEVIK